MKTRNVAIEGVNAGAQAREILKPRRVFRVPRRNSIKSLLSSPHPFPCLFLGRLVLLVARASVCNEWRQTGMTAGLSASQIELFYLSRSRNRPRPVHVLLCIYTGVGTRKRAITVRENERGTFNSRFRESCEGHDILS